MTRAILTTCAFATLLWLAPARGDDKLAPMPIWKVDLSVKGETWTSVEWVGFSPDGRHLCARADSPIPDLLEVESKLRIWDLETKKERLLLAHKTPLVRVSFGPECAFLGSERLIASGYILDLEGKKKDPPTLWEKNPRSHGSAIWSVGKDQIFAIHVREPSFTLPRTWTAWLVRGTLGLGVTGRVDLKTKDNLPIRMASLSPDGKQLAAIFSGDSNRSGTLKLYSVDFKGALKLEEKGEVKWPHKGTTRSLQFSPNGETLASTGDEGTLKLWRTEKAAKDWKPYATVALPGLQLPFFCTAFRPDGRIIAFGTSKGMGTGVGLVDVKTGKLVAPFATGSDVVSLAFSPNSKLLATGGFNGMLHLWDVHTILTDGENQ